MLSEVVLSSTSSASPLPLTSVHSLETGQLFSSLKCPPPASTTTTTTANGKGKQVDATRVEGGGGQTMSFVEGQNGVASCVVGLVGKEGRAVINVWTLSSTSRESPVERLVPPVRLTTVSASPDGEYLVGGTQDGRVFVWLLASGTLVATLDAHYRAVTAISWTRDASCLITASDDAGCSVWSIGHVLAQTPIHPATPFATLSDHTLGITAVEAGIGTFPTSRVFTASKDGTVKIWDLSTTPASLLTTFQFPARVQHLVVDPLERFFFVSIPTTTTLSTLGGGGGEESGRVENGSKLIRVNLYQETSTSASSPPNGRGGGGGGHGGGVRRVITAVGGTGSLGELERIDVSSSSSSSDSRPGESYTLSEPISAVHLSRHSPTVLVATSHTSQVHVLSLGSLLPTRVIHPPPSSTPYGGLTFLTTFLHDSEHSSTRTGGGTSGRAGGGGGGGATESGRAVEREIATSLGRTVIGVEERERGGKNGVSVSARIHATTDHQAVGGGGGGVFVEDLIRPVDGLGSIFTTTTGGGKARSGSGRGAFSTAATTTTNTTMGAGGAGGGERETIERLEKELEGYRKGLAKADRVNERIWKSVVEATLD